MPPRPILLIVEDDWTLRELYRLALSLSDFAVHACEDGIQALYYLEQDRPDLIILDLNLPRVPGTMIMCGPRSATVVYWDADAQSGFRRQQAIELNLVAQGYRLVPSDRRSGRDRRFLPRPTPERRRHADALL